MPQMHALISQAGHVAHFAEFDQLVLVAQLFHVNICIVTEYA